MEFIERTSYVFQWRLGGLTKSLGSVNCQDDQMILQDAALVNKKLAENIDTYYNRKTFKIKREVCPLTGGFILEWYNVTKQDFECKNQLLPFKYENECIIGDGILFHSAERNSNECSAPVSPKGYNIKDKYSCFAHWEDSNYKYMLLKATEGIDYLTCINDIPCMRIPKDIAITFEGYLFPDGTCDSSAALINSHDMIRMKFTKYRMQDECSDGSPHCMGLDSAMECLEFYARATCRNTCSWCKDGHGYPEQTFPKEYQGKWLRQVQLVDDDVIHISGNNLKFPAMCDFINIGNTSTTCMKHFSSIHAPDEMEYMLLLEPSKSDGCSLQSVRISFVSRSDSVLTSQDLYAIF